MNKIKFTKLLHSEKVLSNKVADELWSMICEKSDGIDVEQLRSQLGLTTTQKERYKIIKRLRYCTKSKLSSFRWDHKLFQFGYMFGIPGKDSDVMREGKNKHMIEEELPSFIDESKIKEFYDSKTNIVKYIVDLSEEIVRQSVENSSGKTIDTFKDALLYFSKDEADNYNLAIEMIANDYNRRFTTLFTTYSFEDVYKYLLPVYQEVVIWTEDWTNGIVDAIFKLPRKSYKPVDYKFGQPKAKYYQKGIDLEMTFYQKLIMSSSAVYAHNYWSERKKWKPLYSGIGEMWYVLDEINGVNTVEFRDTLNKEYYKAIFEYWDAMDKLTYEFQPLVGWKTDRYTNYCLKNDCGALPICKLSTSFQVHNTVNEIDDEIDDIFEDLI